MRDDHYKSCCEFPGDYDNVINAIKKFNPFCNNKAEPEREEFASDSVNACIRGVLYGQLNQVWMSTGGAIAIRASSNPDVKSYNKVLICTHGLSFNY